MLPSARQAYTTAALSNVVSVSLAWIRQLLFWRAGAAVFAALRHVAPGLGGFDMDTLLRSAELGLRLRLTERDRMN
jgi:hypothetical protein